MRMYHGTGTNFSMFQCPAYFTDDIRTADFFARQHKNIGTPTILFCEISFSNPLIVDLEGQSWGGFFLEDSRLQEAVTNYAAGGEEEELEYFRESGITIPFLAEFAETCGYDGLIAYNCTEEDGICSTQVVALYPDCVNIL